MDNKYGTIDYFAELVDKFFKQENQGIDCLNCRWHDEWRYEPFEDYVSAISDLAKKYGLIVSKVVDDDFHNLVIFIRYDNEYVARIWATEDMLYCECARDEELSPMFAVCLNDTKESETVPNSELTSD